MFPAPNIFNRQLAPEDSETLNESHTAPSKHRPRETTANGHLAETQTTVLSVTQTQGKPVGVAAKSESEYINEDASLKRVLWFLKAQATL